MVRGGKHLEEAWAIKEAAGSRAWPFGGRQAELDRLAATVGDRVHVLVRGEAGVGKTQLLQELAARMEQQGASVVWMRGVQSTVDLPLAPLLGVVPDAVGSRSGHGDLLTLATSELYRRAAAGPVLLVVDDAHLLAEPVAALVHQAATAGLASVVASQRPDESPPRAIDALRRSGAAHLEDLEPLLFETTVEVVERFLDGALEPHTAQRLFELSAGHPLYLRELVLNELENGDLRRNESGVWQSQRRAPVGERVVDMVAERLELLGTEEMRALVAAAVHPPVPLEVLSAVTDDGPIRALLDTRLLVVDEVDRGRLEARPAHPLHGEAALACLDPLRRQELMLDVAEAWSQLPDHQRRPDTAAVSAELRLAGGVMPTAIELLEAARAPGLSPARAAELADLAVIDDGDAKALASRATARARAFRWPEAEADFEAALAAAAPEDERSIATDYLQAAIDHLQDPAGVIALGDRLARDIGADDQLEVGVLTARLFVRPVTETVRTAQSLLDRDLAPRLRDAVELIVATALSHLGALDEAVARAEQLGRAGTLDRVDDSRRLSVVVEAMAWRGDLDAAARLAEAELALARRQGWVDHEVLCRRVLLVALLLGGRAAEAAQVGRRNAQLLSLGLELRGAPSVFAELALALSELEGAEQEARAALARFGELPPAARYVWAADAALAASRLAPDPRQRHRLLDEALEAASERGAGIHLARALHEAVRLGRLDGAVTELRAVGTRIGGVPGLWAEHADALDAGDHERLTAVSLDAEQRGVLRLAVESAEQAAVAHAGRGELGHAAVLDARATHLRARIPRTVVHTGPPELGLTDRETAALGEVLAGGADADIAGRWGVSVRTVQGHLHRTYRKLNVDGRNELRSLCEQLDPPRAST